MANEEMEKNEQTENQESNEEELDMAAAMGMEENNSSMSQDDINKLMGDQENTEVTFDTVIEDIIYMSMLNYEKLPMLDVIFDKFVLDFTTSLKSITSAGTDITLDKIEYKSYTKAVNSLPVPGVLAVVDSEPWGGQFLIASDASLVYSSLEIMLGGRKAKPAPPEGKNFTSIERKISEKIIKIGLKELKEAFSPLADVDFSVNRMETNPQFATVTQPNSACIHISMTINMEKRSGTMNFVIPYSTLDPIRKLLSKVFFGERLGGDPKWETHLKEEVKNSVVTLKTVFDQKDFTLNEVKSWKVGDTIDLEATANKKVSIICDNNVLFEGEMGKKNKINKAVRIEKDFENQGKMINDIYNN
jgi:flagellar motor switch protein FliM